MLKSGFILSEHELLFFLSLTGVRNVIGLDYEKEFQFQENFIDSLTKKNYLKKDSDSKIFFNQDLLMCISICARSKKYITASIKNGESVINCNYYIVDNKFVRLEKNEKNKSYNLNYFDSETDLKIELRKFMELDLAQDFSATAEVHLSADSCIQLIYPESKKDSIFSNDDISKIELEDILKTFSKKEDYKILMHLNFTGNSKKPVYLLVFKGDGYLWHINEEADGTKISIKSLNNDMYEKLVDKFIELI